jgi:TonB family protein
MRPRTIALTGALTLAAVIAAAAVAAERQQPSTDTRQTGADLQALAGRYRQSGDVERAVETLERAAALEPSNPSVLLIIATYHFERSKDPRMSAAERQAFLEQSAAAADRALAVDPEFFDALVHKSLVLRELAVHDTNPGSRQSLIAEADALGARAANARRDSVSSRTVNVASSLAAPSPPPPPPVPGAGEIQWVYGRSSYTAKGNATTLEKVKDVRPVYPPMAIRYGVQGSVVIEATVNKRGEVVDARVIESVPMLNQSTMDAVRQWRFDPATVVPVGDRVLLTVTATFTVPQ